MKSRQGFTLIELIVALAISSFVLIGIVTVAAQMMRSAIENSMRGDVAGWTLLAINRMNKELQNATTISLPTIAGGTIISGCGNYSSVVGGSIDGTNPVTAFYYCVSGTRLLRYYATGSCPIAPAPVCGQGNYTLIAPKVSQIDAATPYFRRNNAIGGVDLNFNAGNTVVTTNGINPVFLKVSTSIKMNKAYDNLQD